MWKRDVPAIRQYVERRGPDGLVDVCAFVQATIQTPLSRVAPMVDDIKAQGDKSEHLWGFKRKAYLECVEHKDELYRRLITETPEVEDALDYMSSFTGFGLPKAGFVLQCVGYDIGCLDSHNIKRFGLSAKDFKPTKTNRTKVIKHYTELTQQKGTEFWWDSWCDYVAGNRMNKDLPTGDAVSLYHVRAVAGPNYQRI